MAEDGMVIALERARAEIARLREGLELARLRGYEKGSKVADAQARECREELDKLRTEAVERADALLEEQGRATEAERELATRDSVECDYGKLSRYREALERMLGAFGPNSDVDAIGRGEARRQALEALDTQAGKEE